MFLTRGAMQKRKKGESDGRKGTDPRFSGSKDDQDGWNFSYKKETSIVDDNFMLANLMRYLVPVGVDFPAPSSFEIK